MHSLPKCASIWPLGGLADTLLAKLSFWEGPLFRLPSGGSLRYQMLQKGAKGTQWDWCFDSWHPSIFTRIVQVGAQIKRAEQRIANAASPEKRAKAEAAIGYAKRRLPLLGLHNSSTDEILLAADFDKLPPEFASWDALASYLEKTLVGHAVLTRTFSKKCKLVILFRYSGNPKHLTRRDKMGALRSALERAGIAPWIDSGYIDTSGNSMSVLYLPSLAAMFKVAASLPTLSPLPWPENTGPVTTHTHVARCIPVQAGDRGRIEPYKGVLPVLLGRKLRRSPGQEGFVRLLLGTFEDEIDIAQPYWAKRIRECFGVKTAQGTLSKYIAKFVRIGWLEMTDSTYHVHRNEKWAVKAKGKTYRVVGDLACIRGKLSIARRKSPVFDSQAQILDGEWTSRLFSAALHFKSREDFAAWLLTKPGLNASRIRRAEFAWVDAEHRRNPTIDREAERRRIVALLKEWGRKRA